MNKQTVDVLAKYGRLAVETEGNLVCVVDEETLSVTIADVRGPNAAERAAVIVAALNQRDAVRELIEAARDHSDTDTPRWAALDDDRIAALALKYCRTIAASRGEIRAVTQNALRAALARVSPQS